MITKVFAVKDLKGLFFGTPMFNVSVGSMIRSFGDISNDKDSEIGLHPSDYVLFQIGDFDTEKGVLIPCPHVHLGMASDFVKRVPAPALDAVRKAIDSPTASAAELNGGSR